MARRSNQDSIERDPLHAYVMEHCPDLLQLFASPLPSTNATQTASPTTIGNPLSPATSFSGRTSTLSPPQSFLPVQTSTAPRMRQNNPTPAPAQSNLDLRPYWEHDSRAHLEPGGMLSEWPEGPLNEFNFPIIPPPPPKWGKFVAREMEQSPEGIRQYACPVRGCRYTAGYRDMMDHLKSHGPYCAHCGSPLEHERDIGAHVARWHPHLMT